VVVLVAAVGALLVVSASGSSGPKKVAITIPFHRVGARPDWEPGSPPMALRFTIGVFFT